MEEARETLPSSTFNLAYEDERDFITEEGINMDDLSSCLVQWSLVLN